MNKACCGETFTTHKEYHEHMKNCHTDIWEAVDRIIFKGALSRQKE